MPRISLWNPQRNNDYYFADRTLRTFFDHSGPCVYVHKYIGPAEGGDETTISDLLFLENRSRKYDDNIYELRGGYNPQTSTFNLSQFGIFISNDTLQVTFHYNDMLRIIGRKLMAGDVIELPHLADPDTLDKNIPITKRFYTITEGMHYSEGFGVTWQSHIWTIKAKLTPSSPEYSGLRTTGSINTFGLDLADIPMYDKPGKIIDKDGNVVGEICCDNSEDGTSGHNGIGSTGESGDASLYCNPRAILDQMVTDGIIEEAYKDVRFDPKQFDAAHLWIEEVNGQYLAYPWTGDTIPPNGNVVSGSGDAFDQNLADGSFFIRTDFEPYRLYKKEGDIWRLMEKDFRKAWTAYNKVLDTFIDNNEQDTMSDGSIQYTKKALSQTVKPKINLHQSKEDEMNNNGKK